jgi:prepilin-type N-terminal cleavage/methylation domain-containing protein
MRAKKAFTMVELIVVIVTLSILAAYSIPRLNRDTRSEAINHILTMMRYTQNLALHDDKHLRDNPKWQRRFWSFQIANCKGGGVYYSISTNNNMKNHKIYNNIEESAIDPSNGKYLYWNGANECPINNSDALADKTSPNIFISKKYGIKNVDFKNCKIYKDKVTYNKNKRIAFDNFGRYYKSYENNTLPNNSGVGIGDCNIEFIFENSSIKPFVITVNKESGFIYLKENPTL